MMMYRPTTNITASRIITAWTIQWAWLKSFGMLSSAPRAKVACVGETPGIMSASSIARGFMAGQMSHQVRRFRVAAASRAVALALCLAVHGCADVNGGAVELSWKLRATTGSDQTFLDCAVSVSGAGRVAFIRLDWDVNGVQAFRQWPCGDDHGVTGFELPEGRALLRV